jgi:hypothetical protein
MTARSAPKRVPLFCAICGKRIVTTDGSYTRPINGVTEYYHLACFLRGKP